MMEKHYRLIAILILFLALNSKILAQSAETAVEQLQREGRYVNVTLQLGNPLKIFVAGKERARFSAGDLKLEIKTVSNSGWDEIRLNKYGNYYTADFAKDRTQGDTFEVRTTLKNKKPEYFKFNINKE